VRKDMRRKGIASKLVAEIMKSAHKEGASWGTLEVRRSNEGAISLYKKNGFVVEGVRPFYYYTDTREDALIMWVNINEWFMKRNNYGT
jgi:ribosomal-protein-alanine N-acetyltransferase